MRNEPSRRIFDNALEFYNLAVLAFKDDSILVASPNAVVCNLALCVELLLKCSDAGVKVPPYKDGDLLSNAEIFSNLKGGNHDLVKIFERMNKEISEKLISLYKEVTDEDLPTALEKCKDYFVHARYAYELNSQHPYNITSIKNLAEGLRDALLKGWGPNQSNAK